MAAPDAAWARSYASTWLTSGPPVSLRWRTAVPITPSARATASAAADRSGDAVPRSTRSVMAARLPTGTATREIAAGCSTVARWLGTGAGRRDRGAVRAPDRRGCVAGARDPAARRDRRRALRHAAGEPVRRPSRSPVDAATPLISWSIAKSIAHAALGLLVDDGLVRPLDPAPVPEWQGTDKEAITVLDLARDAIGPGVRRGLRRRRVLRRHRHAVRRAERRTTPRTPRRSRCCTRRARSGATRRGPRTSSAGSSATSSPAPTPRPAAREAATREFLDGRLFGPLGMSDADAAFDEAGNWAASSYVHAPARQFARFGELYLRDGCVGSERLLPPGHRRRRPHGRRPGSRDRASTTAATGGCGPTSRARSPPTATKASTSWSCPSTTPSLVHLGKTDATVRDRLLPPPRWSRRDSSLLAG